MVTINGTLIQNKDCVLLTWQPTLTLEMQMLILDKTKHKNNSSEACMVKNSGSSHIFPGFFYCKCLDFFNLNYWHKSKEEYTCVLNKK